MGTFQINQFLNLNRPPEPWNLVRGGTRTYDAAAQVIGSRTGWSLVNPPSEFTMSSAGVITAVLPQYHKTVPGDLTIQTTEETFSLQTTIRDFFPNDFAFQPNHFYSSWRSYDGTARELFVGRYFSPTTILNPVTPVTQFTTVELEISSGDDGYVDVAALQTRLNAISPNGILFVHKILNQVANYYITRSTMSVSGTDAFAYAWLSNGVMTSEMLNGHIQFRSNWQPSDFNSDWEGSHRTIASYRKDTTEFSISEQGFGIHAIAQNRNTAAGVDQFWCGDYNSYPGFRNVGASQIRLNTIQAKAIITIPPAILNNPFILTGAQLRNAGTVFRRQIFAFRLGQSQQVFDDTEYGNLLSGQGGSIIVGDYNFGELALFPVVDGLVDAAIWRAQHETLVDNAVAILGNQSFTYTS